MGRWCTSGGWQQDDSGLARKRTGPLERGGHFAQNRQGLSVPAVAALVAVVAGVLAAGPGWLRAAAPDAKAADLAADSASPSIGPPPAPDGQTPVDVALKEETFEVARQLVKDFPNDAGATGVMGTVLYAYNRTAEAIVWWKKCIEADPGRAAAYCGMATIAREKSDYPKAVELWRKAQEIDPNLPGMYARCAEALVEMGKPEEAIAEVEKEMKFSPNDRENHLLLGCACLQLKDYDKAVAHYEKARQIKPDDSRPYHGLATACARLGQVDKAREYTEQFKRHRAAEDKVLLEVRNGKADRDWATRVLVLARGDAGDVCASHGRLEKAEEHWRRAAALDPRDTICRRRLVELYMSTGRDRQALTFSEQLRAIDPKNATYHLNTGALCTRLEMFDAAEEAVRQSIELAPEHAVGYRYLARILLARDQKIPEAQTLARKLVKLEPTARNYALLGEACDRAGDLPGALAAMQRAVALEPGDEGFKAVYQRLQQRK